MPFILIIFYYVVLCPHTQTRAASKRVEHQLSAMSSGTYSHLLVAIPVVLWQVGIQQFWTQDQLISKNAKFARKLDSWLLNLIVITHGYKMGTVRHRQIGFLDFVKKKIQILFPFSDKDRRSDSFSSDPAVSSSIFVGEREETLIRNDPDKSKLSKKKKKDLILSRRFDVQYHHELVSGQMVASGTRIDKSGATQAEINSFVDDACLQYLHCTDEDQ